MDPPSVPRPIHPPVYPPVHLSTYPSIHLSIHSPTHPPTHPSTHAHIQSLMPTYYAPGTFRWENNKNKPCPSRSYILEGNGGWYKWLRKAIVINTLMWKYLRSSCTGEMGLAASWDHWVTDSIPGLAQWVKDLALPQLWLRLRQTLGTDPWPQNSYAAGRPKIKKKST